MQTFMSLRRNNNMKFQRFNKFKPDIFFLFFHLNIDELLLLELFVEPFYENFVAEIFLILVHGKTQYSRGPRKV